jgi:DNA-binding NtrC family response regulator
MTAATALVVDDEAAVRHMVRRILEPQICGVVEVEDGEAALRLIQRRPDAVDVVLTDVSMPGIDGLTLVAVLAQHQPSLPVLCMSGYVEPLGTDHSVSVPFIQKPFTPEALCVAVAALIERSRAVRAQSREQGRRAIGERLVSEALRARTEGAHATAVDLVAAAMALQDARAQARGRS